MYYECHITIRLHPVSAKALIEALNGWTYSSITGDPDLGSEVYEYATRHISCNNPLDFVITGMNQVADILRQEGFPVVRTKVELVVYDNRSKEST